MSMRYENYAQERIGATFVVQSGSKCTVLNYKDTDHVTIQFDSGYIVNTKWCRLLSGEVKDRGIIKPSKLNEIIDKPTRDKNGKYLKSYQEFHNFHIRSFDLKYKTGRPTYKDVTCCDEWNYFANYLDWRNKQPNLKILENLNVRFDLDKDILVRGNTTYSPETCCLVPVVINQVVNTHSRHRGDLPIGVTWINNRTQVIAKWHNPVTKGAEWSSPFPYTQQGIEDAFSEYKNKKESLIKKIAQLELHKKTITEECYNALINYTVLITD